MDQRSTLMSRRRHTPEQVVRKLREADRLLSEGQRAARGAQASGDRRGDLSPVAESVRRDEGRRRETAEGARGRESEAQADRRGSGPGHSGAQGAVGGKLRSE